jgi:hypothetical protein
MVMSQCLLPMPYMAEAVAWTGAYYNPVSRIAGFAAHPFLGVPLATNLVGNPLTLSVTVTGRAPLSYAWFLKGTAPTPGLQWQFNGVNLDGATDSRLILTNVQPANAGIYTLVVTNNVDRSASFSAVPPGPSGSRWTCCQRRLPSGAKNWVWSARHFQRK